MTFQKKGLDDKSGTDNRLFQNDSEDLDRIEVISTASSTGSDQHLDGSQNLLTKVVNNSRLNKAGSATGSVSIASAQNSISDGDELIELTNATLHGFQHNLRRNPISPGVATICGAFGAMTSSRAGTPTKVIRRLSQSISRYSRDKRSLSEKTIYRLPSRNVVEVDGKLLSANSIDADVEIEQLIKEIEQHEYLMEDTAMGEQNRLETLRALPQPLSAKRLLKEKLSVTIEHQTNAEPFRSWRCRLWNVFMRGVLKTWHILGIICNGVEMWYGALKTIEGHFGSNVGSYFKFLRWLFVLNLLLFVCTVSFITLPQILYKASVTNIRVSSPQESELDILKENIIDLVEDGLQNKTWHFVDLLTGEGILSHSLLFYGSYTNATFSYRNCKTTYSLPQAYYMTMLLLYLFTFVLISTSMARSYRKSFIETSGGMRSMYAQKIFCSWDYGITDRKAADLKHYSIYTELKEVLSDLGESREKFSVIWRIWIFTSRLFAHLLVCAMIVGLGVAIWFLLKRYGGNDENHPWKTLYVATAVNFSMLLLQWIFSFIAKMEDYRSPRRALHISLVRNFVLEAVMIGVLVYFWLTRPYGIETCWETSIGQEIYRLVLSDLFISLLVVPALMGIRIFVLARFWPQCDNPEFDISQKSLGLVFNQTLLWVGLLFVPLLAAIMVVKMVLAFYVNKAMLMHLCKSPRHVWRSAQTQTLYLVFTFLSLLGVIITLGYIMTQVPVSSQCGPFRDYAFMFQILIDGVLKLRENHTAWRILMTLIRPAVVGMMLIVMAIIVYYLRAKSKACCTMVKLLKEMIYLEAKDKEFLLANITNITKDREWLFEAIEKDATVTAAEDRFATASATWRYARRQSSMGDSKDPEVAISGSPKSSNSSLGVDTECVLRSRNV